MFFFKLILFAVSGILIGYGLVLQVRGVLNKALSKKSNQIPLGIIHKLSGIAILGYLIIVYKTQDLILGLASFFISASVIIFWILLARRDSIR